MSQVRSRHSEWIMYNAFPCPKCGTMLNRSGIIDLAEQTLPLFQCPNCVSSCDVNGQVEKLSYIFSVTSGGHPFCPGPRSALLTALRNHPPSEARQLP